jgi:hypothetical protein
MKTADATKTAAMMANELCVRAETEHMTARGDVNRAMAEFSANPCQSTWTTYVAACEASAAARRLAEACRRDRARLRRVRESATGLDLSL